MQKNKCIIILSERSSGSSALQDYLVRFTPARHVEKTQHFEYETVYWSKAASIMGMPQIKMVDSRVPLGYKQAKSELIKLLKDNVKDFEIPPLDEALIFDGWRALCECFAPIFLEKSPHHLCEWSALQLILQCMDRLSDTDFLIVGLVRNPMSIIYSHFDRWKTIPAKIEKQWIIAYKNLLKLKDILGNKLVVVRYEDLSKSNTPLQPIFEFCGVDPAKAREGYFHARSLHKWKDDRLFGFSLSDEAVNLAQQLGYNESELTGKPYFLALLVHHALNFFYKSLKLLKSLLKK